MGAQVTPIINSFTAGELSPHLEGRTDHEKYYAGCRRLENFIPRPHGSVYKRPGTRFVAAAKYPDRAVRLVPFDFNSTSSQSYVIEMGHNYLRFYKDGGVILGADATPYELVTPWAEDMLADVQMVQSCDVMFLVHPKVAPHSLTRSGHTDWTLKAMGFVWPGSDYAVQSTHATRADGRAGDTVIIPEGEAMEVAMAVGGVDESGTAKWWVYKGGGMFDAIKGEGDRTLTFADAPDHNADQIESIHDGAGKLRKEFWIARDVRHCMPEDWEDGNWPSAVALYEDRLVLGATPRRPLTLWLSGTGEYEDFRLNTAGYVDGVQESPLDTDSIELTLSGARVNPIRWVMDQQELLVGTNASEIKVWSGSQGEGMTPAKAQRKRQSAYGSSSVQPQLAANAVLYVTRSGLKIRRMAFEMASDRYASPDITLLADHATGTGVADMDFAREPDGILWVVRNDGVLAGCTYLPEQNVIAWHRHKMGGSGACESVACIPGKHGDETWVLVRRTVGGKDCRYVERLERAFGGGDTADAFLVDSGLSTGVAVTGAQAANPARIAAPGHGCATGDVVLVDGMQGLSALNGGQYTVTVADADILVLDGVDATDMGQWTGGGTIWRRVSEVGGLGHLEGEVVSVVADGAVHASVRVVDGKVALERPAFRVHAGLGYGAVLQPMRLEAGGGGGTAQTKRKRIMAVSLRFRDTVGGRVCPGDDVADKYERILPHAQPALAGEAPRLFSGDREVRFAGGFGTDGLFTVRQDEPLPMTVVCCVPRVQAGG